MANDDDEEPQASPAAYLLMGMVLLWSGALSAGFAWAASTGEMSATRTLAFYGLAAFLALLAGRTAYELTLKIRGVRR